VIWTRRARGVRKQPGEMNKLESAYAAFLEAERRLGLIHWWVYEAVKLKLCKKTHLTVDFFVMTADGDLEAHECKGFMEEDANVKLKVAASLYPFRFKLIRKAKGGQWDIKVIE
jgi:hypothetical protein